MVGHVSRLLAVIGVCQAVEVVLNINGVIPSLAATADSAPDVPPGLPKRSECGIGALMPWADKLYMISYLSVNDYGSGTGLYEIDQDLRMTKIQNHSSVFANRMLHHWTDSVIMGPYVIDKHGGVRVISDLLKVRIGAVAEHLTTPETHVYMVTMEGPVYEVSLVTLTAVCDICDRVYCTVVVCRPPAGK